MSFHSGATIVICGFSFFHKRLVQIAFGGGGRDRVIKTFLLNFCFGKPRSPISSQMLSSLGTGTNRLDGTLAISPKRRKALKFTQERVMQRKKTRLKSNRPGHTRLSHF